MYYFVFTVSQDIDMFDSNSFAPVVLQIDGDNLLHRVFHIAKQAGDDLMANVLAAFFRSLNAALNKDNYTHLLITWDSPNTAPSIRRDILRKYDIIYKDGRVHDPDIYRAKLLVQRACEAVNIPQFTSTTGHESDDLLGSFAYTLKNSFIPDCEIHILTSDKDLIQVVDDDIIVLHPQKGKITKTNCYGLMNVEAHQIISYLVMVGDGADNIPGIRGIGPKTAIKLLEQYGSVNNIMKNIDNLPTGVRNAFKRNTIPLNVLGSLIMLRLTSISEFFDLNSQDLVSYFSTKMHIDSIRKVNVKNIYTIRKTLCYVNNNFGKLHGKIQKLGIVSYESDLNSF